MNFANFCDFLQNFATFSKNQLDSFVDLEKPEKMRIWLQNFVSIQPRTSPAKICKEIQLQKLQNIANSVYRCAYLLLPVLHVLDLPAAQLAALPLKALPFKEERAGLRVERVRFLPNVLK